MDSKPFFIILVCILFLAIVLGETLHDVDLTPDNGTTTSSNPPVNAFVFGGDVSGAGGGNSAAGIVVSGTCSSVYIVRPGDTLSQISRYCGVNLNDLIAANPQIYNPDLIYPDQQINIAGAVLIATAVVPPPVNNPPAATSTVVIIPTAAPPQATATPQPPAPTQTNRLRPGGSVPVRVGDFPANALVQVAIGREGAEPTIVAEGLTDETGTFTMEVVIPLTAKPGERWVVTVETETQPYIEKQSPIFTILK